MANPKNIGNTPQAKDDSGAVHEGGTLVLDVLANDSGGSAKNLYSVNQSAPATVALSGQSQMGASISIVDGKITYVADGSVIDALGAGQTAVDHFTYTMQLGNGALSTATVTVTLTGEADGIPAPKIDSIVFGDLSGTRIISIASDGSLTDTGVHLVTGQPAYGMATADFNNDGRMDVIETGDNGAGRLFLSNGDGTFTDSGNAFPAAFQTRVGVGDFSGNGRMDAVFQNSNGQMDFYAQDATGHFALVQQMPSGVSQIGFADFNHDGRQDLILAGPSGTQVFLNDGDPSGGYFASSPNFSGQPSSGFTALDLNGDSNLDIIALNADGSGAAIFYGDGAGHFSAAQPVLASTGLSSVLMVDVDQDGDLDGVTSSNSGVQWWSNDGSNHFTVAATIDSWVPSGVMAGDIDGDGDPDLVVIEGQAGTQTFLAKTLLNDGAGHFTQADSVQMPNQTFGFDVQSANLGTSGWFI